MILFRKILIFSLITGLFVSISAVLAVNLPEPAQEVVPEQAGVYDVLGRPDLKLKVFVYEPRVDQSAKNNNNGKPNTQVQPKIFTLN